MESLLDYLLYALFGHNVTSVGPSLFRSGIKGWTICIEDRVFITLDENDLAVIRNLYEKREEWLDDEERARYKKIFDLCV